MTNFIDQVWLKSTNPATPQITNINMVKAIWWFTDGNWNPQGFPNKGSSYLTLSNGDSGPLLNLFEVRDYDTDAPLLVLDEGLIIKKDIGAGGFVSSNQGELWLGSGRDDQLDVPKIGLRNSGVSRVSGGGPMNVPAIPEGDLFPSKENGKLFKLNVQNGQYSPGTIYRCFGDEPSGQWVAKGHYTAFPGNFDTLYITKADGIDPAHLDLGNLTAHGKLALTSTNSTFAVTAVDNFDYIEQHPGTTIPRSVCLVPQISPPCEVVGLGSQENQFDWVDAKRVFTDEVMNLNPIGRPRIRFLLNGTTSARSNNLKRGARVLDEEETSIQAVVIDNDEVAGLKQKHLNGIVDEWYSDDEVTLKAKIDGTTGHIIANGITLGTSPAAITFTTGYTTSGGTTIRYLMPDGADKTVGLGSQGTEPHSFAFVNTDRLYVNEFRRLSDGALWSFTNIKKGTAITDANGECVVNFDSAFTATPVVTVTPQDAAGGSYSVAIKAKSTSSFTVKITKITGDHKHYVGQAAATTDWTLGVSSVGDHSHTFSGGSHTHMIGTISATAGWTMGIGSGGSHNHTVVGTTGVGSSHSHSLNGHSHVINMAETSRTTGSSSGHTHGYGDYYPSSPTQGNSSSTGSESGHSHNYSGYSGNHDGHSHDLTNKPSYVRSLMLRDSGGVNHDLGGLLTNTSGTQFDLYTLSGGAGGTTGNAGGHSHTLADKAWYTRGINMRDQNGTVINFGATMCMVSEGNKDMYTLTENVVSNAASITFDWMAA